MELPADLKLKTETELEAWFLEAIAEDPLRVKELLCVVQAVAKAGRRERAEAWAELLQDTLAERGDREGTVQLLRARRGWRPDDAAFRALAAKVLARVFKDRGSLALVESTMTDARLAPEENLRRLDVLLRLGIGTLCRDKTWGFGVVTAIDEFYRKVTIDFDRRPGHQLSFAYAAESLDLIGPDHILARRHRDPEGVAALARTDPAELVRLALWSYGPLDVTLLKEALTEGLVAEADWKGFWDSARKALRADPLVEVPARRSEPLRLLEREEDYGPGWFARLRDERRTDHILALVRDLEQQRDPRALEGEPLAIVAERLAYVARAGEGSRHAHAAQGALAAARCGLFEENAAARANGALAPHLEVLARIREGLMDPAAFLGATDELPAREVRAFMDWLTAYDRARTGDVLLELLPRMALSVLNEAIDALGEMGREPECGARAAALMSAHTGGVRLRAWLCKNMACADAWGVPRPDVLEQAADALDEACAGEALKSQKVIKALFGDREWLQAALDPLACVQRENFMRRISRLRGLDAAEQRSLMARVIKLYPELEQVAAGAPSGGTAHEPSRAGGPVKVTSWRSYRERQVQLRRLLDVEIPENSREIGVARSYGDLRENFEYQTAKDRQRLLMQRQRELEQDLRLVRGTDFEGVPTDKAGSGTCVWLRRPDGAEEQFCILGEWDRDENLGIIACGSAVGQALEGRSVGDEIRLPGRTEPAGGDAMDAGGMPCVITRITGLTEAVRAWVRAAPENA